MTFQETDYLILGAAACLAVLLVGGLSLERNKRHARLFSRVHERLTFGRARGWGAVVLIALSLALLSLALAGPLHDMPHFSMKPVATDVVFALDLSESMTAEEQGVTRLERAVKEIETAVASFKHTRAGLVIFAGSAELACPLTQDMRCFRVLLEEQVGRLPKKEGTALGRGLEAALDAFDETPGRQRAIVLVSDGEETDFSEDPARAAARAFKKGVPVHALMVGSVGGSMIPAPGGKGFVLDAEGKEVVTTPDPAIMGWIAETGHGGFVSTAKTAFPMDYLFREHIEKKAMVQVEKEERTERSPAFQGFALAALVLLVLDLLFPLKRKAALGGLALVLLTLGMEALEEGVDLFEAGRYVEAEQSFRAALVRRPDDADLLVNLGLACLKNQKPEEAALYFDKVLAAPSSPAAGAARFGAALAAFFRAEGGGNAEGIRIARARFEDCMCRRLWPEAAAANIELLDRMEAAASEKSQRGEHGGSGEGRGESKEGHAQKSDVGQSEGKAPGMRGDEGPVTAEEKMRLFKLLDGLHQERMALEQAKAKRQRGATGGIDR